jgi:cell division septum initiation protein DivIVA
MQYDQFGMPIGDDGQPSIDQMQYELARNGKPSPLDSAVNAIKNVAINNNPLMLRKQGIDLAGDIPRVAASGVAPYIAGITQPVVGAYQYASKMPGVLYREKVLGDPQSMQEAATIRAELPQFAPPGARYNPEPMNQRIEAIGQAVAPQTPQGQAVLEGATQVFSPLKLPMIGPGSGLPGTSRVSPRPLITPDDVRVLGAEATRVGKQVVDIPTDFVNAQSGFQRIDPVTGQPVLGARIQSGVDRLGDIMEQRKMQGLTPIPGLPAALQPETSMYAVRKAGSKLTTPTLPETAKEYVPDVDPVGQMLREISIDPNVAKPTPMMLDEIVNDQIKKSDNSNTAMSAFRYFQEAKALELFPDAPNGSDALMALKVSLFDDNARTAKTNELYDQFIQTPEGQEYLPNAASTSELAERHEAAVEGLKNMWGKYLVKNLGTEGNPAVKMAAQEGLTYLPADEVIDAARSQKSTARSFRRNAGTPIEGSFATDITALQQEIETLNLPIKNAANAEKSLNDQLLIAKKMAEQDPLMEPQAREIGNLYKEAKKTANNLVKQKTEIQKKLDKLVLADAYETLEDASVAPIDASTMMEKLPYAVRQFYPDLKEAAKRGEMSYTAYPSPMKETGIVDAAKQFYDDVLANRIPKDKAPTYPVDRYIHGIAKERVRNIQMYRDNVMKDMKTTADAIPENKQFNGNVGVIELTRNTPRDVANKEAALSTEALDICIGEGGSGGGHKNFFTGKKDPRYVPIVDILTGKPNPKASRHESHWVENIYRGGELPMFRNTETGMPIAALEFNPASGLGKTGQTRFNIGYASGAQNGFIDPKYIDGIRDYLNTRANEIAGIGENLEKNAGIYDTTSKSSLSKSRSSAQVSADQMKTVDWNTMPRFMTAKDIKQAVQGNVPAVAPQQSSVFQEDIGQLQAALVDNIDFVVNEAIQDSNLDAPEELERRLGITFSAMQSQYFPTLLTDPISSLNRALEYLDYEIDRRSNNVSEISQEMAVALERYAAELESARDDLVRQQQRAVQPAPQATAPQITVESLRDAMLLNIPEHQVTASSMLSHTFNNNFDAERFRTDPRSVINGAREELFSALHRFDDITDINELRNFGFDDFAERDQWAVEVNNVVDRLNRLEERIQQPTTPAPAPQVAQMQQAEQLLQQIERPLRSTNDGIVNDALQDYSRNLQRFVSNQLQNGMEPAQVATGVRDTINTLRNVVLSQPTDFTRNFTPDQLGDYVSALRQTIDGIGQWLETQNQQAAAPQRANLPTEVQQNIDQRNQDISNAYLNALIPNTNIAIIDQSLSEFADLLHSMSTNLFGAGFNTAEIVERLQARVRAEIMVLSDPDRVINRGLNVAEADTIRSRLNTAYGDLNEVREAYQVSNRQNQGNQTTSRLISDSIQAALTPNTGSQAVDAYLSQYGDTLADQLASPEYEVLSPTDVITRLREEIQGHHDLLVRLAHQPDGEQTTGLTHDENIMARNRLTSVLRGLELNDMPPEQGIGDFEPDNMHGANEPYTMQSAVDMARDVFEQERMDANNFDIPSIEQSIYALRESLFDDERIRRLPENQRQSFSEDVAFRLQNMLDDINVRNRLPGQELITDPADARRAIDNSTANIENDYGEDVANRVYDIVQNIAEHIDPASQLTAFVMNIRRRMQDAGLRQEVREGLDHVADELESVGREAPRQRQVQPVLPAPATAPYRPIPAIIHAMSDRAITADMTPEETTRVQSMFEALTDVNSPEELQNIVSLARSYAMGGWDDFSDVQREWLARNIEEYIGDNPPPNTPPPEGRKDGGRVRKYKKGGTVQPIPSVEQMKNELMMRRA